MSELPPEATAADEPALDLKEIFGAIRAQWLLIFIIGTLFTAGATVLAFSLTPIYRAEVTMVAAEEPGGGALSSMLGNLGGVAAMAGINLGGGKNDVEVSMAMLHSNHFLTSFIVENGLLQEFYAKQWDAKGKAWKVPEDAPTMMDGLLLLERGILSVNRDRRTGIITLAIEWRDRHKAAAWANLMVQRVNEVMRAQAVNEARQSIDFLNKELNKTNVVDLQQAIYRLTESQINRIMMANVREQYAFKVIDPATVPDAKYKVRPKRIIIMAFGAFLGGAVGVALALWRHFRKRGAAAGANA
jgi:uncharacterized protein involved in exopolysaccharide biosynthesis